MDLMTIGEFARLSRLSPKALRIYDDSGLLAPARVDPASGCRRGAAAAFHGQPGERRGRPGRRPRRAAALTRAAVSTWTR
jgi:MerR family regulatory protein